jgi:hypothetical protein
MIPQKYLNHRSHKVQRRGEPGHDTFFEIFRVKYEDSTTVKSLPAPLAELQQWGGREAHPQQFFPSETAAVTPSCNVLIRSPLSPFHVRSCILTSPVQRAKVR